MITTVFLLLIPFVAMRFTAEVRWGVFDFIVAAGLLLAAGLAIDAALRKATKLEHRVAACVGIIAILAVVWIELALGLFGTPLAGS